MIKLIVAIRKRAEMSVAEFQTHWRTQLLIAEHPASNFECICIRILADPENCPSFFF